MDSTAGKILVATPLIVGAPFERSVVVMLEHDEHGAVGVVANLPTDIPVDEVLPGLDVRIHPPAVVFIGGPVATDTAVIVGRSPTGVFLMSSPGGDVGILDTSEPVTDADHVRVFAGYSGWSPGQLEFELAEDSWWVLPLDLDVVFSHDTSTVWARVLASAPAPIAYHATFPDDPATN
jgi:putative transcriptional regulator